MIALPWKKLCANFILPCGENHYGFFLRCPTSFYNQPLNKSGKEIANDLGMSSDNVRMALVRAKRKARQAMEDWKHSTNQAK